MQWWSTTSTSSGSPDRISVQRQRCVGAGGEQPGEDRISDYMRSASPTSPSWIRLRSGRGSRQFDEARPSSRPRYVRGDLSVSRTVIAVNEAAADAPDSINEDPYGSWIAELDLSDWEPTLPSWLTAPRTPPTWSRRPQKTEG
jgi:hypothetical protein